jgi:integrase
MTLIQPQPQRQSQQYRYFLDSLASEATKRTYSLNLRQYCRHLNVDDCIKLLGSQPSLIEAQVINYLGDLKKKGLSYSRLNSMLSAILHFYTMNDVSLNRKKIARFMGEKNRGLRSEQGHAYTREQIAEILSVCDERTRAIILLLTSTGMRIGAIPALKFKHLKLMDLNSDFDSKTEAGANTRTDRRSGIHLYMIAVYGGEYLTFCTPEAADVMDSYLKYRTVSGESIGSESPLFREQFNREDGLKIRYPKHVNLGNLSSLLIDVTNKAGIRQHEIQTEGSIHGQHRKSVPLAHGFRRFFNTALMNAEVHPSFKKLLMGHSVQLDEVYYDKGSEKSRAKLLEEYTKAIDALTINEENRLRKKVEELTPKSDEIQAMKAELKERREQAEKLGIAVNELMATVRSQSKANENQPEMRRKRKEN